MIAQAVRETDPARSLALYKRAQEIVYLEDPPVPGLYDGYCVTATSRRLKDLVPSPLSCARFERAYLE